jgi:hypothetical protein
MPLMEKKGRGTMCVTCPRIRSIAKKNAKRMRLEEQESLKKIDFVRLGNEMHKRGSYTTMNVTDENTIINVISGSKKEYVEESRDVHHLSNRDYCGNDYVYPYPDSSIAYDKYYVNYCDFECSGVKEDTALYSDGITPFKSSNFSTNASYASRSSNSSSLCRLKSQRDNCAPKNSIVCSVNDDQIINSSENSQNITYDINLTQRQSYDDQSLRSWELNSFKNRAFRRIDTNVKSKIDE